MARPNNKSNSKPKQTNKGNSQKLDSGAKNQRSVIKGQTNNNRSDILKSSDSKTQNDPRWYYGDVVLGDEISRFSFNQFAGLTQVPFYGGQAGTVQMPTIMTIPLNPCLGVTKSKVTSAEFYSLHVSGINQALQQWWSLLTSKAGRGAQYSKSDVGILIGAIGEIISMTEACRRPFAYRWKYSERNRVLPVSLINAMGIDGYDFLANMADYRLRLNSLITRLNQIPIPGNINYFAKCQNLYQEVYCDGVTPYSQFYLFVPETTWVIDEQVSQTGSVLRTTRAFAEVMDPASSGAEGYIYHAAMPRKFSDWLDVIEFQIGALLGSSTWSLIYSDLLNAATYNNVTLWHFDLVAEDYRLEIMYDPTLLLQIHNMVCTTPIISEDCFGQRATIDNGISYDTRYDKGTPLNDVYTDPDLDILVQNPQFSCDSSSLHGFIPYPVIMDMLSPTPSPEERIEAGIFKVGYSRAYVNTDAVFTTYQPLLDLDLPDHYVTTPVFTLGVNTYRLWKFHEYGNYTFDSTIPAYDYTNSHVMLYILTKFQWAPVWFIGWNSNGDIVNPVGELAYYTLLDQKWLANVTDAKYLGLFQVL